MQQNRLAIVFGISTCVLLAVCLSQWRRGAVHKAEIISLTQASAALNQKLETQQTAVRKLEHQRSLVTREAAQFSAGGGSVAESSTTPGRTPLGQAGGRGVAAPAESADSQGGMSGMLSKMLEDPNMRKVIAEQQRMGFKMIYSDLFKEMQLSPEEQTKLSDLMVGFQMKNMENARGLLEEGPDHAAALETQRQQTAEYEASIKAFLGDERYAQFEDYSKNIGNRMLVNQLKSELAGGKTPLQEEQAKQLVQTMREETENLSRDGGLDATNPVNAGQKLDQVLSEEATEKFFERQNQLNQKVLERAQNFLTPEQLNSLASHQTNLINMQRMGMKMTQSMMGKNGPAGPGAPPAVVPTKPIVVPSKP